MRCTVSQKSGGGFEQDWSSACMPALMAVRTLARNEGLLVRC